MRRASHNYCLWQVNDKFVGVSLGFDFCAEHEWGISELRSRFGIKEGNINNMGINNRMITKCPDNLVFKEEKYKGKKFAIFYTGYRHCTKEESEKNVPHYLENYKKDILWNAEWREKHPLKEEKDDIVCVWDSSGFGIGVMGVDNINYLKELKTAFENLNVAITHINLSPKNPFSNASLSLLIADRLTPEILSNMLESDRMHYTLYEYEEKIGMKKIKEKVQSNSGYSQLHYFMACSPRWINYEDVTAREEEKKKMGTKYDIQYWINYSDNDNNFGWYTVEEIKEWLTGKKKLTEIRRAYNPEK